MSKRGKIPAMLFLRIRSIFQKFTIQNIVECVSFIHIRFVLIQDDHIIFNLQKKQIELFAIRKNNLTYHYYVF